MTGAGDPAEPRDAGSSGLDGDESITEAETTSVDTEGSDPVDTGHPRGATTPRPRRTRRTVIATGLLAVLLLASAGLAGWLYLAQYRPDQRTDAAARTVARDAATSGTVALLSYSPESLDKDFATAKTRLTGDFLSYYTQFTEQIVTPAAKEKSVKTAASVVRSAVSSMQPDRAEVLVFINQTTTSKENPDGAFAASSVKVGLKKVDGTWLIDSFDPV